jgi:hypothetical protein
MTPREFKAWFEGFTEAFTGCPTKAQWARIKDRVGEIDGNPVSERVFIDRYWHSHWPTYSSFTTTAIPCSNTVTLNTNTQGQSGVGTGFNATSAMYVLGQNDAALLGG